MAIDVTEWLNPIRADAPGGDDLSFSDTFDRIREARRADDPSLSRGDWEHELKTANWREVINLAGGVLAGQSKDLQAAAWLGEALISQHHLDGARAALELLAELQQRYWDELHPQVQDGDLDERGAKLAWFADYATQALSRLPLTPGEPAWGLADWQLSREVDNLGRQNAQAYQDALAEGQPTGEAFDKAVESNSGDALLAWHGEAAQAMEAFARFKAVTDERLGRAGPSLGRLEEALRRIQQIVAKAARAKGVVGVDAVAAEGDAAEPIAGAGTALNLAAGDAAARAAALRTLAEIAAWFKRVEPHSPVPFLLERAVAWADTPLDAWLAEVISDEVALAAIRTRIGLPG